MSDTDHRNSPNIVLLIDADNASPSGIDPVLTVLAELGSVNIRRVYGNWRKQSLKGWADIVHRFGIEPQQQFDLTKGKNATDMKMTIDAMDLLFRDRVDGFGIMSSDSDFTPLAMRIKQAGVPVYGFGSAKTPEAFKQACSRWIDVDELIRAAKEEDSPKGQGGEKKRAVTKELIDLLLDAYGQSKRDERGFTKLSEVGQRAGNRSSFDTRNFGFARLSDLIAEVPNFTAERRDDGQMWVKRLR